MSELDDYIKNELNKQHLEFKDSYWESMEQILDKKNKKVFWLTDIKNLAVVLLFLSSMFYLIFNFTRSENQNKQLVTNKLNKKENETLKPQSNIQILEKSNVSKHNQTIQKPNNQNKTLTSVPFLLKSQVLFTPQIPKDLSSISTKNLSYQDIDNIYDETSLNFKPIQKQTTSIKSQSFPLVKRLKFKNWIKFISPFVGFNQNIKAKFKDNNLNNYKNQETIIQTKTFGLNLLFKNKGFTIGTGLNFNTLKFKTKYITPITNYTFDTSFFVVNPNFSSTLNGNSMVLLKQKIDTNQLRSTLIHNPNNQAQFNYIQIPLFVQYEYFHQRFGIFAEAGINAWILNQTKGEYLLFDSDEHKINILNQSKNVSKMLINYQVSLGFKYRLNTKINLVGSLGTMQSHQSIIKSYNQKQRQNTVKLGLEIGLF